MQVVAEGRTVPGGEKGLEELSDSTSDLRYKIAEVICAGDDLDQCHPRELQDRNALPSGTVLSYRN